MLASMDIAEQNETKPNQTEQNETSLRNVTLPHRLFSETECLFSETEQLNVF